MLEVEWRFRVWQGVALWVGVVGGAAVGAPLAGKGRGVCGVCWGVL